MSLSVCLSLSLSLARTHAHTHTHSYSHTKTNRHTDTQMGGRTDRQTDTVITWTTYADAHLKFLGCLRPLIRTCPDNPFLFLRSANTSNNLLQYTCHTLVGVCVYVQLHVYKLTKSFHCHWDPLWHSTQAPLIHYIRIHQSKHFLGTNITHYTAT